MFQQLGEKNKKNDARETDALVLNPISNNQYPHRKLVLFRGLKGEPAHSHQCETLKSD